MTVPRYIAGNMERAAALNHYATDLGGRHVPANKLLSSFYLDQGSANPLLWRLNDASTAYGLAAIVTVEGKKASYEVLRGAKPRPPVVTE